ncbi:hypothetical protein WA158_003102 [Blastocystis sp. Blastoise]
MNTPPSPQAQNPQPKESTSNSVSVTPRAKNDKQTSETELEALMETFQINDMYHQNKDGARSSSFTERRVPTGRAASISEAKYPYEMDEKYDNFNTYQNLPPRGYPSNDYDVPQVSMNQQAPYNGGNYNYPNDMMYQNMPDNYGRSYHMPSNTPPMKSYSKPVSMNNKMNSYGVPNNNGPMSNQPMSSVSGDFGHNPKLPRVAKSALYKTRKCRNYDATGFCRYGDLCQFAHGDKELRAEYTPHIAPSEPQPAMYPPSRNMYPRDIQQNEYMMPRQNQDMDDMNSSSVPFPVIAEDSMPMYNQYSGTSHSNIGRASTVTDVDALYNNQRMNNYRTASSIYNMDQVGKQSRSQSSNDLITSLNIDYHDVDINKNSK